MGEIKIEFLFIALDGCAYRKIEKYRCSFLLNLCTRNQHGILWSIDKAGQSDRGHPWTGPCWNTIYTGKSASEHGVTAEVWATGEFAELASKVPTFFHDIQEKYTVGLMALPALYPTGRPIRANGWVINGFPAKGRLKPNWFTPSDLEIPSDFELEGHTRLLYPGAEDDAEKEVKDKVDLMLNLVRKHKSQVVGIGIQHLDFTNHSKEDVERPYRFIDSQVTKIFDHLEPKHFVICSDHGFDDKTNHSYDGFYVISREGGYKDLTIFDIYPIVKRMIL